MIGLAPHLFQFQLILVALSPVSVPAPAAKPAKARVKVYITDGKNEKIETDCTILYFIKTVEKPVTLESSMLMHKVVNIERSAQFEL